MAISGLLNVPFVFMCLMNGVFIEYMDKFVVVFLDGFLIYSKSKEDHEYHFRLVLRLLRENHMYAKL
jgi:hypothetical protein